MDFNKAYNRSEFLGFLRTDFLPEDFIEEATDIEFSTQTTYSTKAVKLGTSESLDLVVYEIKHQSKHDARVGLSKEAFRLLADEFQSRALVIFVPEDSNANYRFSLIEITLEQEANSAKVKRNYSNPRRYSYYLGEGIAFYTANKYLNEKGRVIDIDDLHNRFSVEVLTKAFYQELSDWYAWAVQVIRFPNKIDDPTDDDKYNHESVIRLITRLIFVWFLKQKHLIPNEFFDEKYINDNLIQDFNPHGVDDLFYSKGESRYYKAILQNLFFAMLNCPITPEGKDTITERHFRNGRGDFDINKLMRYEDYFINPQLFIDLANQTVPFLNGGLFDCLDDKTNGMYYDGFSDRKVVMNALVVPDYLFFVENREVDLSLWYNDKKRSKVKVNGLVQILKKYNFTIEENTPFDKEVSLDPELLGKVFENLLASYNPETQTTARKQTGSFYTPREIVQYMVDESLIAHLKRTVSDDLEDEFRKLMRYTDEEINLTTEQKKQIMKALYECKILDPACGSGAFPMGALQQMVHILNRIDPNNEQWKNMMLDNAISESSEAFRSASFEEREELLQDINRNFDENVNRPDYARKLYLIENCIYGVDIQPIAIQISKLRFFISLVVDQIPTNRPEDNFGVRPLPNLEAKFVAANTLIGLENKEQTLFDSEAIREKKAELKVANHRIFSAKTKKTKDKYRQKVQDLRLEISDLLQEVGAIGNNEAHQLAAWDMFDQNSFAPFFDPDWMFGVTNGFDIVIANPPYISYYSNTGSSLTESERDYYVNNYQIVITRQDRINSMNLMTERALLLLKSGGNLSFIVNKTLAVLPSYISTREFILNNSQIEYIVQDLSPFDAIVDCIIIGLHNNQTDINGYPIRSISKDLKTHQNVCSKIISGNRLLEFIFPKNINLLKKIEDVEFCLKDLVNINRGVNIGGCFDSFLSKYRKENSYRKYISGTARVKPYLYSWEAIDGYLKLDIKLEKELKALGKTLALGDPERFNKEMLFIPESSQTITSAYCNDKDYYTAYGIMVATAKNTTSSLKYICGILNSKLITYYATQTGILRKGQKATPHVGVKGLNSLPIPNTNKKISSYISNLVDIIIANRSNNDIITQTCINIDKVIYQLYNLTYDEVLIVDPNTPFTQEEYENEGI